MKLNKTKGAVIQIARTEGLIEHFQMFSSQFDEINT